MARKKIAKDDEYNRPEFDPAEMRARLDTKRRAPLTLRVNCGKCQFFANSAAYGLPCQRLGVTPGEDPCAKFIVAPSKLGLTEEKTVDLLKQVSKLDQSQLDVLAAILHAGRKAAKHDLNVGQTVYFRVMGGDFVKNYVRGVVLSVNAQSVFIYGKEDFTAQLNHTSLLNAEQWKDKKAALLKKNKAVDPDAKLKRRQGKLTMDYEPPLFDREDVSTFEEGPKPEKKTTTKKPAKAPPRKKNGAVMSMRGD